MANWFKFCKEKIEKIEKVWNRKLDEKHQDDEEEEDMNDKEDDFENAFETSLRNKGKNEDHEKQIG